jgi:hypothetical protein
VAVRLDLQVVVVVLVDLVVVLGRAAQLVQEQAIKVMVEVLVILVVKVPEAVADVVLLVNLVQDLVLPVLEVMEF